ncbi:hypothetical protein ASE75_05955 [Sphingomonas sp. Leaf17]|uniref:hypothetical protein n=1 Tax=Sphingomonas sp. Leaf17 TaxID=1735683 RepID=UPI0006F5DC41|nr:hypothetical protein [Sphingomonas sp. Leaf17]KQM65773.1 hypothetical protein ASE75_05955 [Sphingomonas sp. Leaf17]
MDEERLRLPRRFVLTIEGDQASIVQRCNIARGQLEHLLSRLMIGQPVAADAFTPFGIRITIEPDTDGGPEEPDYVSRIGTRE